MRRLFFCYSIRTIDCLLFYQYDWNQPPFHIVVKVWRTLFEWPELMNIDYFYLTNQMTANLSWNSFVTEDNKLLCNTVASSWLFITSITKELLLQESESIISLIYWSKFKLCRVIRRWPPCDARQTLRTIGEGGLVLIRLLFYIPFTNQEITISRWRVAKFRKNVWLQQFLSRNTS